MITIEDVLAVRRASRFHDEELWAFMESRFGRDLINLPLPDLSKRLGALHRNILFLDSGRTPRDDLPADRGWLSPWWWLRARYLTLLEFEHRGATPAPTAPIARLPPLRDEFIGVNRAGSKLLARIGSLDWLPDMLERGCLRFARASSYRKAHLDAARRDDELSKSTRSPGQRVRITMPDGRESVPIGDVNYAMKRVTENGGALEEIDYWLCSFSSEVDPRLFEEFRSVDPVKDALIVIFDPNTFVKQALPRLNALAPLASKRLFPVNYYDPYWPRPERISPLSWKTFEYALQQEMRFVIDPENGPALSKEDEFYVEIGSISGIAGIYHPSGKKLAGAGPDTFLRT